MNFLSVKFWYVSDQLNLPYINLYIRWSEQFSFFGALFDLLKLAMSSSIAVIVLLGLIVVLLMLIFPLLLLIKKLKRKF